MLCPSCNGPTIPLLTSRVCAKDCDLRPALASNEVPAYRLPTSDPHLSDLGTTVWAARVLTFVSAVECVYCPCTFGQKHEGLAFRYHAPVYWYRNPSGKTWFSMVMGWTPTRLLTGYPGHQWSILAKP